MTALIGQDAQRAALLAAARGGTLHHAWLLTGPAGVGKASFASAAAAWLLASAVEPGLADRGPTDAGFDLPPDHRTARLIAGGAHPDFRLLARLPKENARDKAVVELARNISVDQVRGLQPMFATRPALSARRVVVIDAADDLQREGANALLKNLEEPPAGTIFLLVSHAPGRLLPTIRSRCRLLRFAALDAAQMAAAVAAALPEAGADERAALVAAGTGAPGRAIGLAGLGLERIERDLAALARDGDADNARRVRLAKSLSLKAAQPQYELFLERAPSAIAQAARRLEGERLRRAIGAWEEARTLAGSARALSLDAQATVFEMAGLVARLAF